ncbi:substrate-binding domain-containing protein [Clostridium sp. SHJSY1]|uniref:substrate-binding domain-containing protein n=1 Tax=Clostridium sp. SHJSY1 TaxID=2942483 RepID=UPI0037C075AC
MKSAPRAVIVTGDAEQAGSLQGKILADIWKSNTATIDRNKDNILQYSMLQGSLNNASTILRSKNSIKSINSEGIKTNELSSTVCNWNKECAKINIETSFITLGNKIEAIISNNDEMAIGAIEALQKYGFNKNDKLKYIPIVGIGGLGKAKELIDQGIMAGTVIEDLTAQANAIYNVGMNLVSGKYSLDGTNLKFDETGMTIKIPYYKYVKQ